MRTEPRALCHSTFPFCKVVIFFDIIRKTMTGNICKLLGKYNIKRITTGNIRVGMKYIAMETKRR